MPSLIDLTGHTYGRLHVLSRSSRGIEKVEWTCRCACGALTIVHSHRMRSGKTRSCGCLQREEASERFTRHGATRRKQRWPEWGIWRAMINRCYRPTTGNFHNYGGRGITVCDRWRFGEGGLSGFECFIGDMGRRPDPALSVDRINNDGDYEPANCKWATAKEQANNRRRRA